MRKFTDWVGGLLAAAVLCGNFVGVTTLADEAAIDQTRPKVGIALSGGGARGIAHIGVLRALEELGVPIDYIAGTSMGSVVGGLYAAGLSVDELEEVVRVIDWNSIFSDELVRPQRTFRRKRDDDLSLSKLKVGFKDGRLGLPSGFIQGEKFDLFLRRHTLHVRDIDRFDDLTIPYRAVATDIGTGDMVVMGDGDLVTAMHASLSVPGAFAAVKRNGRLLVDGGISNNLPIDVVRNMGADVVIAVDISSPLLPAESVTSVVSITGQLIGIMTRENTEAQIATLTERDVLILPDLGELSFSDFEKVPDFIALGEQAGRSHRATLRRLAGGPAVSVPLAQSLSLDYPAPVIEFVRIDNDSALADEVIAARVHVAMGKPLDVDALENDIAGIYALDVFESVSYRLVHEDGRTGLTIVTRRKSWGVDFLQLALRLASDFGGRNDSSFGLTFTKPIVNRLGGEWRSGIRAGSDPEFFTELHQPLDVNFRWFANAAFQTGSRTVNLFEGSNRIAAVETDRWRLSLAGGRELGRWGALRSGFFFGEGDNKLEIGDPLIDDQKFDEGKWVLQLAADTFDNLNFPTRGVLGRIGGVLSRDSLGASSEFDQLNAELSVARSWGRNALVGTVRYDTTLNGEVGFEDRFLMGGFLNLSGFQQNELSGADAVLAQAVYYRKLRESRLFPVYVGGSIEWGNVFEDRDSIRTRNLLLAGSAFIGVDTLLGPVYAAYGAAETGPGSVYLLLGRPFSER